MKPQKHLVMLTCWFNFAKCVDYLLEPYTDRIGSEEMKLKCDDFEAKGRNVNVVTLKKCQCDDFEWCLSTIDMMIRFKVKMITSQGLLQVFTNNFILVI